jgi:hypothetical protein
MKKISLFVALSLFVSASVLAAPSNSAAAPDNHSTTAKKVAADNDIIGRWDLTVNMDGRIAPLG